QTGAKHKRRPPKAYHAASLKIAPQTSEAWWELDWLTPEPLQKQTQLSEEMGKKSHKSQAATSQDRQDIGVLLQRTPKPREQDQAETGAQDLKETGG
ncbi:Hypothetical predicted protein, partial [Pelobates cultripes]